MSYNFRCFFFLSVSLWRAQVDRDKRLMLPNKRSSHNRRKGSSSSTPKEAKWGKGRGGSGPAMQEVLKRESERWDPD